METTIRQVNSLDIEALQQISRITFADTFAEVNSPENMNTYLESKLSKDQLLEEIHCVGSQFYFAVIDEEIAGYLKVNSGQAQTENQDINAMEIERIYVLKAFHGKKVGQHLYEHAVKLAEEACVSYIWLGVWEENHRALAFYRKNGFEVFGSHLFKLGHDEQVDLMMKKIIITRNPEIVF